MTSAQISPLADAPDPVPLLSKLLTEGTAALSHLDVDRLEQLQQRALELQENLTDRRRAVTAAERAELESCRRILGAVLRSTREHLDLLRRMSARGEELPWVR